MDLSSITRGPSCPALPFKTQSTPSSYVETDRFVIFLFRRLLFESSGIVFCWRESPLLCSCLLPHKPMFSAWTTKRYKDSAFCLKLGTAVKGTPISVKGSPRVGRGLVLTALLPSVSLCLILFLLFSSQCQ